MRPEDIDDEAERRIDEAAARFLVEHRERSERERKERLTRYFRTAYETATTDGSRNGIRRAAKDRIGRTWRRGAKRERDT